MSKARPVAAYIDSTKEIMRHFGCAEDIFIRPLTGSRWTIRETQAFQMLSYWGENDRREDAVIVKKNGEPLLFKTKEHTMVVAIDCVKIGFVFENKNFTADE